MADGKWSIGKGHLGIKYLPSAIYLLPFAILLLLSRPAHALTIDNVNISPSGPASPILYETGESSGTTISFRVDQSGFVQVAVSCGIQNFGDAGTNVANLGQVYSAAGTYSMFWNGLWLIGGDFGRTATTCDFTLAFSTSGGTPVNPVPPPTNLVKLNSVDIHNVTVTPSVSATGSTTFPYVIGYSLAKAASVSVTIMNSSSATVRTLLKNQPQVSEAVASTMTLTWDGLADNGTPAPLGTYTLTINATDPAVPGSNAIPRTQTLVVQSLAGAAGDPQKLFESNVYVYPNPVRNGQAFFNVLPVRDGATIHLRIYTITGTLVLDQDITAQLPFKWTATNQSGNKVGRGLYYYVVREDDVQGTLQATKKMAVLP
jgi:flagellar hook assembly protein FlgD